MGATGFWHQKEVDNVLFGAELEKPSHIKFLWRLHAQLRLHHLWRRTQRLDSKIVSDQMIRSTLVLHNLRFVKINFARNSSLASVPVAPSDAWQVKRGTGDALLLAVAAGRHIRAGAFLLCYASSLIRQVVSVSVGSGPAVRRSEPSRTWFPRGSVYPTCVAGSHFRPYGWSSGVVHVVMIRKPTCVPPMLFLSAVQHDHARKPDCTLSKCEFFFFWSWIMRLRATIRCPCVQVLEGITSFQQSGTNLPHLIVSYEVCFFPGFRRSESISVKIEPTRKNEKNEDRTKLLVLLPDKFGFLMIRVQIRSWPNSLVDVVNTQHKAHAFSVKSGALEWYFKHFFNAYILINCQE
jgi:hypothetical protein